MNILLDRFGDRKLVDETSETQTFEFEMKMGVLNEDIRTITDYIENEMNRKDITVIMIEDEERGVITFQILVLKTPDPDIKALTYETVETNALVKIERVSEKKEKKKHSFWDRLFV